MDSRSDNQRHIRDKIRKTVVAFPFIGDELGGSHISAIGLITGLDKSKYVPLIIIHQKGLILEQYLNEQGLPFVLAPKVDILSTRGGNRQARNLATGIGFLRTTIKLVRFLRHHNVDIVHTNDGQMHATWALAARSSGAKLLWHHRADPTAIGVNMVAPVLANHIVTVSRFVQPLKPILPVAHKITVLHSPFEHPVVLSDRDSCRREIIEELRLPSNTRFVGHVGALIERKRPVKFVEAVHAFLQRHPDFPLAGLLFGSSAANVPYLDGAVRKRADELGISDRIHLMGFRAPIAPCMTALDALLVAAINEPFGRTLIEAMLLGTPVIATDHGGNPEAIADGVNGYLVEPEKPEAFVPPLEKLLFNRHEWERISVTAREDACAKYGSKAHIDGISQLYERLVFRKK